MSTRRLLSLTLSLMLAGASIGMAQDAATRTFLTKLGDALPAPQVESAAGDRVDFTAPAPATVVHLFACDSELCGESLPAFEADVWQPLRDRGVRVVGIGRDAGASDLLAVAKDRGITFPLIPDPDRAFARQLADGGKGIPRTIIADGDGKIVYQYAGFRPGRAVEARLVAEAILDGRPIPVKRDGGDGGSKAPMAEKLYAKPYLGEKAPEVFVEKWITDAPPDAAGKWVLIEFWATWCGPCVLTMPHLEELSKTHADRLIIKSISDEDEATVAAFVKAKGFTYPIGIDTQRRTIDTVEVRGIPHGLLVDPEGVVRWQGHPMTLAQGDTLEKLLAGKKSE